MDDANLAKAFHHDLMNVFLHHTADFLREEAVEIDPVLDRQLYGFIRHIKILLW